jgi:hypothetical protein
MRTFIIITAIFMSLGLRAQNSTGIEYKKNIAETNYQKGNLMVSAFPIFSTRIGNLSSNYGFSIGQSVKYGRFMANKLCLNIGSYQNFQYSKYEYGETRYITQTTWSTVSLSLRYLLLNKRFTPFVDAGWETFFVQNKETVIQLNDYLNIIGSAYAGIGLSIPVSNININLSGRYLYPVFKNNDALINNRIGSATGWQPEFGLSYIFNKNKKALKETYFIK